MRILLLNPPATGRQYSREGRCQSDENAWLDTFPPVTLASIAGTIRNRYHEVKLVDSVGAGYSAAKTMQIVSEDMPDHVVLNTATPTLKKDLETAKEIKRLTNAELILVGECAAAKHRSILQDNQCIDYVILGEPETPIIRILEGNKKIRGVASKSWDGGFWHEPDLDALPMPAYDLLPPYYFPLTGERWMFVRSSRGCPYECSFCTVPSISGTNVRAHSPSYMLRQFEHLSRSGINAWMLWDDVATLDRSRMEKICNLMIKRGLQEKAWWCCTTRADLFDPGLAKKMGQAGCRMVSFGIESGNDLVLRKNKGGITRQNAHKAVLAAKRHGIISIGHFIMGLPGSNEKAENETISFSKKLPLDLAQFYIATPFYGSKLRHIPGKRGLPKKGWGSINQGLVSAVYGEIAPRRLKELRRRAYFEFYARPRSILFLLSNLSVRQIPKLQGYIKKFVRWGRGY